MVQSQTKIKIRAKFLRTRIDKVALFEEQGIFILCLNIHIPCDLTLICLINFLSTTLHLLPYLSIPYLCIHKPVSSILNLTVLLMKHSIEKHLVFTCEDLDSCFLTDYIYSINYHFYNLLWLFPTQHYHPATSIAHHEYVLFP